MKKDDENDKKPKRSHARAEGSTVIGVSMTKQTKARIQAAAAEDGRTMASFCSHYLLKVVREIEEQQQRAKPGPLTEKPREDDDDGEANHSRFGRA